jgi:benzoate transport
MTRPLHAALDEAPMTRFQWSAVSVCVLLNMLDGFDVLVMAFTGRTVATEWGLSGAQLGLLLSAGLVGMAAGSLLVAPWADRFGRRPLILGCLAVASAAMLLSAASQSAGQLGLLRVLTGVGIGGILASSNVIAAEYASRRWRGLAVSLNSTGYAIGATAGGFIAVVLIGGAGWRAVFLFGGIATAVAIPLVWWRLPESLDFLLVRRPPGALERANALAARLGIPRMERLPEQAAAPGGVGASFRALLSPGLRRTTLLMWVVFFCVMAGFYFVTSWTPALLVEAGLTPAEGITAGTLLNMGGIFGAALLGLLAARFPVRNVLIGYLAATAVLLAVFIMVAAASASALALAFTLGGVVGLFVNGCVAGIYSLSPVVYGPAVRTTGVGTALAIGRAGAILAPTAAGTLLDAGWTPQALYLAAGVLLLGTAAVLTQLRVPAPAASPAIPEGVTR